MGTPADVRSIVELWQSLDDVLPSTTDDEPAVHALLARDPQSLLVAEVANQVTGTLVVGWDGWRGNLYRLAVTAEHRRGGVAASLVAEAEHHLASKGCQRIAAVVTVSEEHAMQFWGAAGYQIDGRVGRFVKNI